MVHQRRSERGRNPPAPELTIWPVGQAVKTAASHAVNVGSIPARVTKKLQIPSDEVVWSFLFIVLNENQHTKWRNTMQFVLVFYFSYKNLMTLLLCTSSVVIKSERW